MNIIMGAVIAGAWQVVGHWVPWHLLLAKESLGRMAAYTWGIGGILLGILAYCLLGGAWEVLLVAVVMSVAAGVCTLIGYGVDELGRVAHELRMRRQISAEEEE